MSPSIATWGSRAPVRLVSIADLAKRLGVTSRALRHYQDQGLIRSHRMAGNIRAYDVETVAIVETIVALREVDLPIVAIRAILALQDEPETQVNALRAALLKAKTDKLQQIARIDAMVEIAVTPAPSLAGPGVNGPARARISVWPLGRQVSTSWRQESADDRP